MKAGQMSKGPVTVTGQTHHIRFGGILSGENGRSMKIPPTPMIAAMTALAALTACTSSAPAETPPATPTPTSPASSPSDSRLDYLTTATPEQVSTLLGCNENQSIDQTEAGAELSCPITDEGTVFVTWANSSAAAEEYSVKWATYKQVRVQNVFLMSEDQAALDYAITALTAPS